ncbi:MAG: hypothetical protein RIQ54_582 [Candidatus Parcubacteria bacterium]|jgi:hypothetical protein
MYETAQAHLAPWFYRLRHSQMGTNDSCLIPRSWTSDYFRRFFLGSTVFVNRPADLNLNYLHVDVGDANMQHFVFGCEEYRLARPEASMLLRDLQSILPHCHCVDPFQVATIMRHKLDPQEPCQRFLFFTKSILVEKPVPLVANCTRLIVGNKIIIWNIHFKFIVPVSESVLNRIDSNWSVWCLVQ